MKIRLAKTKDLPGICELIHECAERGGLLPRSHEDISAHLASFVVLVEDVTGKSAIRSENLLGCVSLESYGRNLAEIRSLAVVPEARGRGLGGKILQAALNVARQRRIARVFAVTHAPDLFERRGFVAVSRDAVPEKLERDCRHCSKAVDCHLAALVKVVCPERELLPISKYHF